MLFGTRSGILPTSPTALMGAPNLVALLAPHYVVREETQRHAGVLRG